MIPMTCKHAWYVWYVWYVPE